MKAALITRNLHTRGLAVGVAAAVLAAACAYYAGGFSIPLAGDKGLGLPSANLWLPQGWLNFGLAMAGTAATVVIMLLLNKVHNVMRSMTSLYIALFCLMQLATPELMTQFYTGTLLAVVVPLCMLLLFNCYRDPGATRQVFLISVLLSLATATQYCYAFYIPSMLVGCAQMRIFSRRTLAAALMGLLTPWIILLGFGIVSPEEVRLPDFVSIFAVIDIDEMLMMLIAIGFTALIALLCYILNVVRTIAYNARARAVNGAFTIVGITTAVAMCADFTNLASYVPLFNFCAAMEVTHFFSIHRAEKSFIAILSILAVYAALFACQIII